MESSSANRGFFQQQPVLRNQLHDDVSLQRVIKLFLPSTVFQSVQPEIDQLAEDVLSPAIFDWIADAEKNLPYLRGNGRDSFGKPRSELVVAEGWRKLQEFGIKKGVVASNYNTSHGKYSRLVQCVRLHVWEGSCANTLCPAAMQDGAARLLQVHLTNPKHKLDPLQRRVFQDAFDRLTSRDPSRGWTSGQWMTERIGGSDVFRSETVATYWFSSATGSGMTILLAKTRPDKGLSAFLAPLRWYNPNLVSATGKRGGTELNGVTISRLKNKLGTQSLPTAELGLDGMRGWLVGEEGRGIYEISTILNITRVHSTTASMGYLGRGLANAKSYALVREVGVGKGRRIPLFKNPLHMRTLASITGEYHAMMLLTFFAIYVLGLAEKRSSSPPDQKRSLFESKTPIPTAHVAPLLRVLSSLHKAYVCETTVPNLYGCMEALGGVGYLLNMETEHVNVARLFRDACVLAIWEGTTDVLSYDALRALRHPGSLDALDWFVRTAGGAVLGGAEGILKEWDALKGRLKTEGDRLLAEARSVVFRIAEVLIGLLLLLDAQASKGVEGSVMARRFLVKKGFAVGGAGVKDGLEVDTAIVFGSGGPHLDTGVSKL